MKTVFLSLMMIITEICFAQFDHSANSLSIKVNVVNHINYEWFKCERGNYGFDRRDINYFKGNLFPIEIFVKNNSNTVIKFWEMTCSWQDNWLMNDSITTFFRPSCDGNFPAKIKIEPGNVYSHKCFLYFENPVDEIKTRDLKVGFILIKEQDYVDPTKDYRELISKRRSNKQHLIWSNSFKLN